MQALGLVRISKKHNFIWQIFRVKKWGWANTLVYIFDWIKCGRFLLNSKIMISEHGVIFVEWIIEWCLLHTFLGDYKRIGLDFKILRKKTFESCWIFQFLADIYLNVKTYGDQAWFSLNYVLKYFFNSI